MSQVDSLRRVLVEVEEPVLSHQLQWAFGAKLSELTVTGRKLRVIFPDALLGLHSTHELVLRLTGTSIRRLPAGLLRYLADVRYLTLDLRGNLLFSMGPEVLRPTGDQGFWRGTQHLAGEAHTLSGNTNRTTAIFCQRLSPNGSAFSDHGQEKAKVDGEKRVGIQERAGEMFPGLCSGAQVQA